MYIFCLHQKKKEKRISNFLLLLLESIISVMFHNGDTKEAFKYAYIYIELNKPYKMLI
jgi:predicted PolB exonuclease-like 3'-5' exonuclease